MRITCPNCSAAYDVPDAALASGPRLLRCARCAHSFEAALPAGEAAPLPQANPLPPAMGAGVSPPAPPTAQPQAASDLAPTPRNQPPPRLADAPASMAADRFALLGWAATVVVVGGGVYAAYAWRGAIMAAWPPARRLFAALGLG